MCYRKQTPPSVRSPFKTALHLPNLPRFQRGTYADKNTQKYTKDCSVAVVTYYVIISSMPLFADDSIIYRPVNNLIALTLFKDHLQAVES